MSTKFGDQSLWSYLAKHRQTDRQTLPIAKPALQPMDRVIMQMLSVGEARRSRGRGFWTAFSDYTGPDLLRSTVFHF